MGNIVAQGNSNSIGCRIVVDGVVKAEKSLARGERLHLLRAEGRMISEQTSTEHTKPPFVPRTIHRLAVPIILAWMAIVFLVSYAVPPLEQVAKQRRCH